MAQSLPLFDGYYIDVRLKQFRRVKNQRIIFIDFSSNSGERMLDSYIKSLNPRSKEFKNLIYNL